MNRAERNFLGDGMMVAGGRIAAVGGTFMLEAVLARRLEPIAFATYLIAFSVAVALSHLFTLGLNRSLLRRLKSYMPRGETQMALDAIRSGLGLIIVGLPFVFLGLGVGLWVLSWANIVSFSGTIAVAVLLLSMLLAMQQTVAETLRSVDLVGAASMFAGVTGGPLFVWIVFSITYFLDTRSLENSLWLLVWVAAAVLLSSWCIVAERLRTKLNVAGHPNLPMSPKLPDFRLVVECVSLALVQFAFYTSSQVDLWLAPYFLGESIADYASSRRLVMLTSAPLQLVNVTVIGTIPLYLASGRIKDLEFVLRKAATVAFLPSLCVLLMYVLFPSQIIGAVYGGRYAEGNAVLQILSVAQLFNVWTGACGLVLIMSGRQVHALIVAIVSASVIAGGALLIEERTPTTLAYLVAMGITLQFSTLWILARLKVQVWTHPTVRGWRLFRPKSSSEIVRNGVDA